MTGVMRTCDPDQIGSERAGCWEGFSGTRTEFGGLENCNGLTAEVEDALAGEAREGAREGLARDAGRLGHLLAAEGRLEDDAPLGDAALLGGEVEEHAGHPLGGAAKDEVTYEIFELAGPGG